MNQSGLAFFSTLIILVKKMPEISQILNNEKTFKMIFGVIIGCEKKLFRGKKSYFYRFSTFAGKLSMDTHAIDLKCVSEKKSIIHIYTRKKTKKRSKNVRKSSKKFEKVRKSS
jgi:hypothetical protein